eukprot:CAMPEP_0202865410 /NCGR_PEP_ID=MMETSP1391-20130828/5942_1 /ASSEMBLY_ACC=CAM_ASM_000867 /TAXON_ID=1034604 /ORGANISM="Chlamydomonas leiostraca, Strain SAG 11-49" /LENGTH=829 /DNA_ID=CAMNT_0049545253 /DNA_START=106 /DNA_END=2595 /DNA_ORIENTATION=+
MARSTTLVACIALVALLALPACRAGETVDMSATPKVAEPKVGAATGTDASSIEREKESISATRRVRAGSESFAFQAEVNRMMDIIIHSLYSNKDIFLRELISNASDALDKIRFLSLTDKSVLGEGDTANLEIQISLDKENKILTIRDRGIGMTKDDLIKNLGTIAKSGTSAFLEQMQKGGDINLIGQFGVGFYSVYLVADWVEVISKHNDDKQWVWSSGVDGGFTMAEDTEGEPLGRGTMVRLHLKPEALEYSEESKLRDLVGKYSEFINFPIYMETEKEVEVPIEEEGDAKEEAKEEADTKEDKEEEKEGDDGVDDAEDDDDEEEEGKEEAKKTRKEKRKEWDLLNDSKAIWLRAPKDVSEEEYKKFYKAVSKDYGESLGHVHFKAEGDVEFKAVLFVPKTVPYEFYDKYYEKGSKGALKLYVRRVFITDDADELLPRWLGFLRGIVDSDTLPLNVSREMLQQHAALKTIKKKIIRKVLDLIKKWADDEAKCRKAEEDKKKAEEGKEEEAKEEADADIPTGEACTAYETFWSQYGRAMKLGMIEDATNRGRLTKLLRFHTSKSPEKLTSLDEYIARMKDGQKDIYYLAGATKEEIAKSPFVEQLLRKGYEVIYYTDVLDEYVMQHVLDYDDKKFANVAKEDLKLADKDEKERKRDKELKDEFKDLTKWWKKLLGDQVTGVKVSARLATTPCVVVAGKYGQSANMERIMRAQAFQDPNRAGMHRSQKVFEINPRHPVIRGLKDKVNALGEDAEEVTALGKLLYESAMLESGFILEDPKEFTRRVQGLVRSSLGVASDAEVEAEVEADEVEEKGEDKAEAEDDDSAHDEL